MMAGISRLERIGDLVDRLTPLIDKQRGMPIEAEDWNALVAGLLGVLEIDRGQERDGQAALADNFARISHDHIGETSLEWLDPDLQDRLGGGGGGGLSTRALVAELEKRVESLGAEVASVSARDDERQQAIDRATSDAVERSRTLRAFETRFEAVNDLRTMVGSLDGQLAGLSKNVKTVLKLRTTLTDEQGEAIDVAGMRRDVAELQELRDNLTGIDGKILPMRELELRIGDLRDAVGVGGDAGLDGRIAGVVSAAEGRLVAQVSEGHAAIRDEIHVSNAAAAEGLRAEIRASVDASTATLGERLTAEAEASEAKLAIRADEQLATATASLRDALTASTNATIETHFAGLPGQIRSGVDAALATREPAIEGRLTEALTADFAGRLKAVETSAGARADAADQGLAALRDELPSVIGEEIVPIRAELTTALEASVAARLAALRPGVEAAVAEQVTSAVTARLEEQRVQLEALVQLRATELGGRVAADVQTAVGALSVQVTESVRDELAQLDLDARLDKMRSTLVAQVRSDLERTAAELRAEFSTRTGETTTILRAEMAAGDRAATETAVSRSSNQITELRSQLGRVIDPAIFRAIGPR